MITKSNTSGNWTYLQLNNISSQPLLLYQPYITGLVNELSVYVDKNMYFIYLNNSVMSLQQHTYNTNIHSSVIIRL